jgi:hypothetical protein
MADEIIAITMKYSPVPILNVVAEAPELPQGEMTENPMPAPKDKSTSVRASDATRGGIRPSGLPKAVGGKCSGAPPRSGRVFEIPIHNVSPRLFFFRCPWRLGRRLGRVGIIR